MERATTPPRMAPILRALMALAALMAVTACGTGSPKNAPEVNVIVPAPNSVVTTNVSMAIQANISGDNITRVDVYIDGQAYAVLTTDDTTKGMPTLPVNVPWTPPNDGVHVLQFTVYGPDGQVMIKSDPVVFKAVAKEGAATP